MRRETALNWLDASRVHSSVRRLDTRRSSRREDFWSSVKRRGMKGFKICAVSEWEKEIELAGEKTGKLGEEGDREGRRRGGEELELVRSIVAKQPSDLLRFFRQVSSSW